MRTLRCACRLDKTGAATPCPAAGDLLDALAATRTSRNPALHQFALRALLDHMRQAGLGLGEIMAWAQRGAANAARARRSADTPPERHGSTHHEP